MSGSLMLGVVAAAALWPPWPFGRDADREVPATIASLADEQVHVDTSAAIDDGEARAIESYREFLALAADDPRLRAEAMRRLADLSLETDDALQPAEDGRVAGSALAETITLYTELLDSYSDYARRDLVLYQLARAYEAAAETDTALAVLDRLVTEHPDTPHAAEAHFRRGETLFVAGRYAEAESAYRDVLGSGQDAAFAQQSLYKLGWSLFKQSRFDASLVPFFELLDAKLARAADADPAAVYTAMGRADQELVDDTFRVLSIGFSYLDGADSVSDYFADNGIRNYTYIVYTNLGDLYLEQERYQDAADAYRAFIELEPLHPIAPLMQVEVAEAYRQGGFADLVLDAKRRFVTAYGGGSAYWQQHEFAARPDVVAHLKANLGDLAAHHHAAAQRDGGQAEWAAAARWYRASLQTFPDDADAAQTNFLLAEVLFESGEPLAAATEYERTAYAYPVNEQSAEAGYAALLAYDTGLAAAAGSERMVLRRQRIDSALRFAATWPGHTEAAAVQTSAAEALFAMGDFGAARGAARAVVMRESPAEAALERTAWTVIAHSEFDLGNFAAAESAYRSLAGHVPPGDAERGDIDERIAASIYRQGEIALADGQQLAAVDHFLRVGHAVPNADIRATAEYDAAAVLLRERQWTRAGEVLERFRRLWPEHALVADATAALAVVYVESDAPLRAADEFARIADSGAPDVRREALWQAAELYADGGATDAARREFARFVERYPEPVAEAVEARHVLAELAGAAGDRRARVRWLDEIITADAGAGDARTDRTRFLAAHAQLELAAGVRDAFRAARLVIPLQQSLSVKRERMEAALAAYGRAADYGVAGVTTAATYEIAELYNELGRALFDSERPPELADDELAQYEILLEEQAFPFEEEAIGVHEVNAARTADGIYDEWVERSLEALAELLPVRYAKREIGESSVASLH